MYRINANIKTWLFPLTILITLFYIRFPPQSFTNQKIKLMSATYYSLNSNIHSAKKYIFQLTFPHFPISSHSFTFHHLRHILHFAHHHATTLQTTWRLVNNNNNASRLPTFRTFQVTHTMFTSSSSSCCTFMYPSAIPRWSCTITSEQRYWFDKSIS